MYTAISVAETADSDVQNIENKKFFKQKLDQMKDVYQKVNVYGAVTGTVVGASCLGWALAPNIHNWLSSGTAWNTGGALAPCMLVNTLITAIGASELTKSYEMIKLVQGNMKEMEVQHDQISKLIENENNENEDEHHTRATKAFAKCIRCNR